MGRGAIPDIAVEPGRSDDLSEINDLYNHYVRETPVTFDVTPIGADRRQAWFEQFASRGPYRLLVARRAGRVEGFAYSAQFRPKEAYATSVETTIYLRADAVGRGIGTRLYAALFDELAREDVHRAYAGITLPNDASVSLHRKFGFREVGIFHSVGRKFDRYWSVGWFERAVPGP